MGNGPGMTEMRTTALETVGGYGLRKTVFDLGWFLLPLLVVALAWEGLSRVGLLNAAVLPPPSAVFQSLGALTFEKKTLLYHLGSSLYRLILGYVLAVAAGVAIGSMLGINRLLRDAFSPALSLLIGVPTIAWVPVLLITLGLGDETVITAIFLGGVFEVVYSTIAGIRSISPRQINAARIMGVKGPALFFKVLLPGSLVTVVPVLRLSIGYCWRALVGAEMLSAMIQWGLGKMIYEARLWNDVKVMIVGLLIIGVLGMLFDRVFIRRVEQATIVRWGMTQGR
jgi:ABC-type nitrate/sulfonate/bicarbonate transport system permease component